jgi:hypothetical protein
MRTKQIDLRNFIGETLELLVSAIPDEVVFSCRFEETPDVLVDPGELQAVLAELLTAVCHTTGVVQLRIGTIAGKSGPHAFVEVSSPVAGTRIVVPIPAYRPNDLRVAAASAVDSD